MTYASNGKGQLGNQKQQPEPQQEESVFETFPEPRGWPGTWVGSGLYNKPRPSDNPNQPKR
jgi:hypothetical protein